MQLLASVTLLLATERRSLLLLAAVRLLAMILRDDVDVYGGDALGGLSGCWRRASALNVSAYR